MTLEQRLAEIEARHKAATKGPWDDGGENGVLQTTHITRDVWHIPRTVEDVTFIANAHDDIPFLLAEIRRLQKEKA